MMQRAQLVLTLLLALTAAQARCAVANERETVRRLPGVDDTVGISESEFTAEAMDGTWPESPIPKSLGAMRGERVSAAPLQPLDQRHGPEFDRTIWSPESALMSWSQPDSPPAPQDNIPAASPAIEGRPARRASFQHRGPPPKLELTIGARTWLSQGRVRESIAGRIDEKYCPSPRYVNVVSELTWRDVRATITEINAELLAQDRWLVQVDVGFGGVDSGVFDDFDYCTSGRQDLFSHTQHPVSGDDVNYVLVNVGYRLFRTPRCRLDLLVGHQVWNETLAARDGVDLVPGNRTALFQGRRVITQEYNWQSVHFGGRSSIEWIPRIVLESRILLSPWSDFRLKDIHHLRDDLEQNPSFTDLAGGRWGVTADATLSVRVWRGLRLEVGYQVFYQESHDGIAITHTPLGDGHGHFNGADQSRSGLLIGATYGY